MNKEQLKGQWQQLKGQVKERWGKLTDNELTQIDGKYDQLIGKIQERYGCQKEEAEEQFSTWNTDTANKRNKKM